MSRDRLRTYLDKRDFRRTPEPAGSVGRDGGELPVFVIQEHDARTHHFDFRLEIDGVLASWAVPKGPSTDPRIRRLAIRTEDHPCDYADFEGTIPDDEYGGGSVIVWDAGSYRNLADYGDDDEPRPMGACLDDGHLKVWLDGEKLQGGYALTRTDGDRWLLVKMDDEAADARRNPVSTEPASVLSGRRVDEVADDDDARR